MKNLWIQLQTSIVEKFAAQRRLMHKWVPKFHVLDWSSAIDLCNKHGDELFLYGSEFSWITKMLKDCLLLKSSCYALN